MLNNIFLDSTLIKKINKVFSTAVRGGVNKVIIFSYKGLLYIGLKNNISNINIIINRDFNDNISISTGFDVISNAIKKFENSGCYISIKDSYISINSNKKNINISCLSDDNNKEEYIIRLEEKHNKIYIDNIKIREGLKIMNSKNSFKINIINYKLQIIQSDETTLSHYQSDINSDLNSNQNISILVSPDSYNIFKIAFESDSPTILEASNNRVYLEFNDIYIAIQMIVSSSEDINIVIPDNITLVDYQSFIESINIHYLGSINDNVNILDMNFNIDNSTIDINSSSGGNLSSNSSVDISKTNLNNNKRISLEKEEFYSKFIKTNRNIKELGLMISDTSNYIVFLQESSFSQHILIISLLG